MFVFVRVVGACSLGNVLPHISEEGKAPTLCQMSFKDVQAMPGTYSGLRDSFQFTKCTLHIGFRSLGRTFERAVHAHVQFCM